MLGTAMLDKGSLYT